MCKLTPLFSQIKPHKNVLPFKGACVEPPNLFILTSIFRAVHCTMFYIARNRYRTRMLVNTYSAYSCCISNLLAFWNTCKCVLTGV